MTERLRVRVPSLAYISFDEEFYRLMFSESDSLIDNIAKGGLTIFWELLIVIPSTLKHLKR